MVTSRTFRGPPGERRPNVRPNFISYGVLRPGAYSWGLVVSQDVQGTLTFDGNPLDEMLAGEPTLFWFTIDDENLTCVLCG